MSWTPLLRLTVASSLLACLCIAGIAATPAPASAFGMSGFGAKLGYLTPENLDGTMAISGHLEFAQPASRLHLIPSVMFWNSNNLSDVSANADLYYHFAPEGLMTPYVGAGLGVNFFNHDGSDQSATKLGANFFGGLRLPAAGFHYFVEGRYTASDISQFGVMGGITFHSGSH